MSLAIGTQLGSHEITALLGKGGMGEVYRARDTKLKREVAIKILPDEFSRDPERLARFQREAEVLASLNHPNIAAIYDVDEANSSRFLVLEFVGGETRTCAAGHTLGYRHAGRRDYCGFGHLESQARASA